jgi:hypothetical protein
MKSGNMSSIIDVMSYIDQQKEVVFDTCPPDGPLSKLDFSVEFTPLHFAYL